jgi:glyoxylase-like metal-dependent hydrolase (beta-lactamase superfamily II)
MIEVQVLPIGPLRTNVVLVGDPERREAIVVDPAIPSLATLMTQLAERGWRLVLALATHGHWDHMGEMAALAAHHATHHHEELPIGVHPLDRHRLIDPQPLAAPFPIPAVVPTRDLNDGDRITAGSINFTVLHTPGHTEGSISLFDASAGLLLSGDTLFFGGWGRTDLPGGDAAAMLDSLGRLRALDPATRVIPGHGRETMISTESAWIDNSIRTKSLTADRS